MNIRLPDRYQLRDYATAIIPLSLLGSMAFLIAQLGLAYIPSTFSEEITTQNRLEQVVREEAEELGLDSNDIKAEFGSCPQGRACSTSYMVRLDGDRTRNAVQHELYHIYKDHHDMKDPLDLEGFLNHPVDQAGLFLKGLVVCETQANVYAAFGIKL